VLKKPQVVPVLTKISEARGRHDVGARVNTLSVSQHAVEDNGIAIELERAP